MRYGRYTGLIVVALLSVATGTAASEPLIQPFLNEGRLADAEAAVKAELRKTPDNQDLMFQLGAVRFFRAVERLTGSLWEHGFLATRAVGILGNLPVTPCPNPKPISYSRLRGIMLRWASDLEEVEASLAKIDSDDVRLPLRFGMIRLDFNGDGAVSDDDALWRVFLPAWGGEGGEDAAAKFVIDFDLGDAYWLRGYCHLLMGIAEFALAHDFHDLFERTGHLLFAKTETPHLVVNERFAMSHEPVPFTTEIVDVIALVHLMRFSVAEPDRMRSSLRHFEQMIDLSRRSWEAIDRETDNESEWLPNPKQTSVMPGGEVMDEMIQSWRRILREAESILAGKKLVPMWRGVPAGMGLNIRRIFTEPRDFDLILWVQGTAATPYLEKGELTDRAVWSEMADVFGDRIFMFTVWFN